MTKRYWVYAHGSDGEINRSLGDFDNLGLAIEAVRKRLSYSRTMFEDDIIRITEKDEFGSYNTIWIAGPIEYMKETFSK